MSPPLQDVRQPGNFGDVLRADPEAWAIRIRARWQMGVEAIISTGRLLLEAKEILPHGSFQRMVEEQLPFKIRMAQMLMTIAANPLFSNAQYIALLPPTVTTMYDCARLTPPEFERGVVEGIINPEMERADIERIRPRQIQSSDGQGSPVETARDPAASSVQEGLATPVTDNVRDDGNVAKPEGHPEGGSYAAPHGSPGPSEATQMPGGGLSIAHNRVEPSDSLDFFPTPPWATRALFERVLVHLDRLNACKFQTARDPCCGRGHMSEVMRDYFRHVIASDIADYDYPESERADFTQKTSVDDEAVDWLIMNSPFGALAEQFWSKSMDLAGYGVAMLVRAQWLETPGRYLRIFKDNPPSLVAFFSERVPIHKGRWVFNGKTFTAYVWLVWIKGMQPQPPFWIPPGCRPSLTKADDAERFGALWEDDQGNEYPFGHPLYGRANAGNEAPASEAAE